MTTKRKYAIELVAQMLPGNPTTAGSTAESIVDRLQDEGLLHLGYGDADIDRVVEKFQATFGTTKVSRTDRFAANRLVKKYGAQAVTGIIDLMGQSREDRYAPIVNNISELEDKFVSVTSFLRKRKGDEVIQL